MVDFTTNIESKMLECLGMDNHDDKIRADERAKTIDDVIKTLAESEDTILSDKQYYEVLKLKGGADNGEE